MKLVTDPKADQKALVREGYDRCAAAYERTRWQETAPALSILMPRLPEGARVLDVGCGAGVPVVRELARRYDVTGVDLSGEMVTRARINVPEATIVQADIMALDFAPDSFDAVVSFYAIFHIPREEHAELFRRIHCWLKPGGYLLTTLSDLDEPTYTEDDFFGVTMVWSNYSMQTYRVMLAQTGFELLDTTDLGHGYADHGAAEEHHPLILAQKQGGKEMNTLLKKLRLLPGYHALVLNPPAGYIEHLGELPNGLTLSQQPEEGAFDFVHLFVRNSAEFDALGPTAREAVKYDGILWISYPKRSAKIETDLSRDSMWELLTDFGMRPVAQVSVDDTWSAVRFRPSELVNTKS
jgi:SAM-dependent methyltransferase